MLRRSQQRIKWHHKLFIAPLWRMPLQRFDRFPSVYPSTPLSYGRTPPLSDCSLPGRPCPLVTILSRCLPALHPPSSAGCANWPTVDKCIKVDSDYNWSLRINYTRWNSDKVITQLTVRAVLDHLATWLMIVEKFHDRPRSRSRSFWGKSELL